MQIADKADALALEAPVRFLQGPNVVLVKTLSKWTPPVVDARILPSATTNVLNAAEAPVARP